MRRRGMRAIVSVAVAVAVAACSPVGFTYSGAQDTTGFIAATTWLVEADVTYQQDGLPVVGIGVQFLGRELDLEIVDIVFQRSEYEWSGEAFSTPRLSPGQHILAHVSAPSADIGLEGRRVFVALQAAGAPDELEAQVRRNDGKSPYAVIMLFDDQWRLVDAATGYLDQYAEVYALYGQGRDAALALIADAIAGREARDEAVAAGRRPLEVTTPGPLGEWRRELGVEGPPPEPFSSDRLEAWLADPPEARQLFVTDDEVIPGADRAVGVDGWVPREVVIADVADLAAAYPWVGLRFAGVGVLGPFGLRTEDGPDSGAVSLFGYFPAGMDAELVGWTSTTFPDLATAEVIATFPSSLWGEAGSVTVTVTGDPTTGFRLQGDTAPAG